MNLDFLTKEEKQFYELKFLETCKKIGTYYKKALDEQKDLYFKSRNSAEFLKKELILSTIQYHKYKIKLSQLWRGFKITFYGKMDTGGSYQIFFKMEDQLKIHTNRFINYPMKSGEILEIICNKYDLNSKEKIENFIEFINKKDIDYV